MIDNKEFDPSSILIICHIVVTVIGNGSGLRSPSLSSYNMDNVLFSV